jgi:hypothetical protein
MSNKFDTFKIGHKEFSYNEKEAIFYIRKPCGKSHDNPSCNVCGIDIPKKFENCTFCGFRACKDHAKKSRPYPLADDFTKKSEKRGLICLLCDRKFIIRQLAVEWNVPIMAVRDAIVDLGNQQEAHQLDIEKLHEAIEEENPKKDERLNFLKEESTKLKLAMEKLSYKIFRQKQIVDEIEPQQEDAKNKWTTKRDELDKLRRQTEEQ